MSTIDNLRKLSTPMLILFIASRCIFAFGLGILLARYLGNLGWVILILGILLAIPDTYQVLTKK